MKRIKKHICFFIVGAAILSACGTTKVIQNDLTTYHRKGSIKTIFIRLFNENGDLRSGFIMHYNRKGFFTMTEYLGRSGMISLYKSYYNKKGQREEVIMIFQGKIMRRIRYKYNNQGKIIFEEHLSSNGKLLGKILFKYDPQGKLMGKRSYVSKGKLSNITTYDSRGFMIQVKSFKDDGTYKQIEEIQNNNKKNPVYIKVLEPDGKIKAEKKFLYVYDSKGNIFEKYLVKEYGDRLLMEQNFYVYYKD